MDVESEAIVDWAYFSRTRTELGASFVRILGYFQEDGEKAVARIEDGMHRRDAAALVLPAHTLKTEARQFGAEPIGEIAERIEFAARRAVESRLFPDDLLPSVVRLRQLFNQTMALFAQEMNPLAQRRPAFGRAPTNQEFGRI
ncbi:Hpt domain-containing protein [Allosphingosinicella vermicomposti]|uniref:Hpt domain-containing protein n=1 Tax=Allosphingosinicella vermicomposti TaxID=614671 RepID=UPI001FE20BF2|nr:Hpt domain-containing protein [Allosphingosinicella vermicomposti]